MNQVSKAVQNTLKSEHDAKQLELLRKVHPNLAEKAGAPAPAVSEKDLIKDTRQKACVYADEAYQIQVGKDGINEVSKKLKALDDRMNEKVYAIAKLALTDCQHVLNVSKSYFLALIGYTEKHILAKHIKATREDTSSIGKLMPSWSTYKSAIAAGLEFGIDPDEESEEGSPLYATAAAYIKAVSERRKAEEGGTGSQAGEGRSSKSEMAKGLEVITSGWNEEVRGAFKVLNEAMGRLVEKDQKLFLPAILQIASAITTFADARRDAKLQGNVTAETMPQNVKDGIAGAQASAGSVKPEKLDAAQEIADKMEVDMDVTLDAGTRDAMSAAIANAKPVGNMTPEEHGRTVATELARAAAQKLKGATGGGRKDRARRA